MVSNITTEYNYQVSSIKNNLSAGVWFKLVIIIILINWLKSSTWRIDGTLVSTSTQGQKEPVSNSH